MAAPSPTPAETTAPDATSARVETLAGVDGVLADPSPQALAQALGEWAVVLRWSAWTDTRCADFLKVRSEGVDL